MKLLETTSEVFTGFNANIDVVHQDGFQLNEEAELHDKVESIDELKACLNYCKENGENHELDYTGFEIQGGEEYIGGQGGIMSNFLAGTGNGVLFYTPYLSQELADMINEKVLYPIYDKNDEFVLKSVRDAANSDRTKKNHIFEFQGERTGRLILSDSLKGYGPYLSKDIEENLELLQKNVDCCIFSGFHNVSGNREAKIKKAGDQLSEIEKPVHLEYVHKNAGTAELLIDLIMPEVDSLGLDETELQELCSVLGINCQKPLNFGEAFAVLKNLREELGLSRIHLHTYRFHITIVPKDYSASLEQIRNSMLYGELAAIQAADKGHIPDSDDLRDFDMDSKYIQDTEELEDFGDFHGLEEFHEEGTAVVDGLKVVGLPIIVHEDPERTVGMGDIISSGAFSSEIAQSQDS